MLIFTFFVLALAQTGTVYPTTRVPLHNGLSVDDLVNNRVTSGVVYNASTFDIGTGQSRYMTDGILTVNFPVLHYVLHILYNYWSTVTTVPFTSDDPSERVYQRRILPSFTIEYTRVRRAGKTYLVPETFNRIPSTHPFWEWRVQVSECAHTDGYDVCTFPAGYGERNANAIFNSALIVVFDQNQQVVGTPYFSTTHAQSPYYLHWMGGPVTSVSWTPQTKCASHDKSESEFNVYWTHAPPMKSITEAPVDVRHAKGLRRGPIPVFDLYNNAWNSPSRPYYSSGIDYDFRTKSYGVFALGTTYHAPLDSYIGVLPDNLRRWIVYPAYSMGKGLWSGLLYGAIDKAYGATFQGTKSVFELPVVGNIPNASSSWDGITVKDLLDMNSRHQDSTKYYYWQLPQADESTFKMEREYFNVSDSGERIGFFVNGPWSNNQSGWVYRTINYEGAAYIVRNAVEQKLGKTLIQLYKELICEPLHLSKVWCDGTLTTYDARKQEWGGYGSFGLVSDFAILSEFLVSGDGFPILNKDYYESLFPIKSRLIGVPTNVFGARNPDNVTRFAGERWSNGFWTNQHLDGCPAAGQHNVLTYLSGYGGNRLDIAVVPKNTRVNGVEQFSWVAFDLEDDYDYIDAPQCCYLAGLINPPVGYSLV